SATTGPRAGARLLALRLATSRPARPMPSRVIVPGSGTGLLTKATSLSVLMVPLVCGDQVLPPSPVWRIVPFWATTQPLVTSGKATPPRKLPVPLVCGDQVLPPSPVWRIVPSSPTAQPLIAEGRATSGRALLPSLVCGEQVVRPSQVWRIVP